MLGSFIKTHNFVKRQFIFNILLFACFRLSFNSKLWKTPVATEIVLDKCQKIILVRFVSWVSNLEIISFFKKSDEISLYCSKNHCKILRFLLKSWRNFWQLLFEPCFRWLLRRWKNILLITVLLYFQSFENMLSTCTFFKSTTFISI